MDRLKIMKKIAIFLLFLLLVSTANSLSAQWWDGVSSFGTVEEPTIRRYGSFGEWTYGMPLVNITSAGRFEQAGLVRDENGTFVKADRNAGGGRFAEPFAHKNVLTEISQNELARRPQTRRPAVPRTKIVPFEVVATSVPHSPPPRQKRIPNYYQRMPKRDRTRPVPESAPEPVQTEERLRPSEQDQQWMRQLGREEMAIRQPTSALSQHEFPFNEDPEPDFYVIPPQKPIRDMGQKLELALIQSLEILPRSPLFVSFENGIATVSGIVAGESDRLRAEQILLEQPGVGQVINNLKVEYTAERQ